MYVILAKVECEPSEIAEIDDAGKHMLVRCLAICHTAAIPKLCSFTLSQECQ